MDNIHLHDFICAEHITIVEAMKRLSINKKGILFIADSNNKLIGSMTDGDIRRWLVRTGDLTAQTNRIMNKTPIFAYEGDIANAHNLMNSKKITALPILSFDNNIIQILFASEESIICKNNNNLLKECKVIIMAGGKGTRLYPYTKILPKPLIPIGDIPIIEHIINRFRDYGVSDFFIPVNYKKGMIKSYFADLLPDYSITYIEEEKPLGTAGSLKLINEKFKNPTIVTNCDILIEADYSDIYNHHIKSGNKLTIVSALKKIVIPYGVIKTGNQGNIESIDEKPCLSYFVNTGMYVLESELFSLIPDNTFFHMTDLVNKLLKENIKLGIYPIGEDAFLDMGELEEMRRMEKKLMVK